MSPPKPAILPPLPRPATFGHLTPLPIPQSMRIRTTRKLRTFALPAILIAAALCATAAKCMPPGSYPTPPCTQFANPGNAQAAVDAAGPGAVICVDAGTYAGPIVFNGKSGVTLRGAGAPATTIAGGSRDALLVLNSRDISVQNLALSGGHPTDAYVSASQNVALQGVSADRGGIGVHFDNNSTGNLTSSVVDNSDTDGVLVRNGSGVRVDHSNIIDNHGAGVSAVGGDANVTIDSSLILRSGGPGVFVGQVPCAGLPGGSLYVPSCYYGNLGAYVSRITLAMNATTVQDSGNTGVVLFPGTNANFTGNHIVNNRLTGVFGWGASLNSAADEFAGNEEHALELRAYPAPGQQYLPANGRLSGDDVHDSVVLAASGKLGGGVLAQGAHVDVDASRVHNNRGIGISFVNGATGSATNDAVYNNGGSAICTYNTGAIYIAGDTLTGNANNTPGACVETT